MATAPASAAPSGDSTSRAASADSLAAQGNRAARVEPWARFRNSKSNLCLGISRGNMANGTKAIQWPCNNNADQFWATDELGRLINLAGDGFPSGKCLGVPGGSHNIGAQLVIWDCNPNFDQRWVPTPHGSGMVVWNQNSNKIIGVAGGSLSQGAAVVQWNWEAHADQIWFSMP